MQAAWNRSCILPPNNWFRAVGFPGTHPRRIIAVLPRDAGGSHRMADKGDNVAFSSLVSFLACASLTPGSGIPEVWFGFPKRGRLPGSRATGCCEKPEECTRSSLVPQDCATAVFVRLFLFLSTSSLVSLPESSSQLPSCGDCFFNIVIPEARSGAVIRGFNGNGSSRHSAQPRRRPLGHRSII